LLAQSVAFVDTITTLICLLLVVYVGWVGFTRTKSAADYAKWPLVGPIIMALLLGVGGHNCQSILQTGRLRRT